MQSLTVKPRETTPPRPGAPRGEPALADVVKHTAGDLMDFATAELRLVKLEVVEGLRAQAGRAAGLVVGAVPILLGYLCAVAALASWLTPRLGMPGALATTALSQVVIGVVVMEVASRWGGRPAVARSISSSERSQNQKGNARA